MMLESLGKQVTDIGFAIQHYCIICLTLNVHYSQEEFS